MNIYNLRTDKGTMFAQIIGMQGDLLLASILKHSAATKMKNGNRAFKLMEDMKYNNPVNPVTLFLFKGFLVEIEERL